MAVLDIDGTLVTKYKKLRKRTILTIRELVAKGIPVCLSTGRNIGSTLPVARKLGLKSPCMCIDGMIMYDLAEKKIIYESTLPNEVMREVLEKADKHNVNIQIVTWGNYNWLIKDKGVGDAYKYGSFNLPAELFFRIYKYAFGVRYIKSIDPFLKTSEQIYLVVAMGDEAELQSIQKSLENHENKNLSMRLEGNLLSVSGKNASKSYGLQLLCSHYGISIDEVVAIGDELNDLEMIQAAGMGIAMENANQLVKEAAKFVTKSNEEDGAAFALERFFEL